VIFNDLEWHYGHFVVFVQHEQVVPILFAIRCSSKTLVFDDIGLIITLNSSIKERHSTVKSENVTQYYDVFFQHEQVVAGVVFKQDFHKVLVERRKSFDKLLRNTTPAGTTESTEKTEFEDCQKALTLQQKWNMLWRLSLDMKKKLQDNFALLLQVTLPFSGTSFNHQYAC